MDIEPVIVHAVVFCRWRRYQTAWQPSSIVDQQIAAGLACAELKDLALRFINLIDQHGLIASNQDLF